MHKSLDVNEYLVQAKVLLILGRASLCCWRRQCFSAIPPVVPGRKLRNGRAPPVCVPGRRRSLYFTTVARLLLYRISLFCSFFAEPAPLSIGSECFERVGPLSWRRGERSMRDVAVCVCGGGAARQSTYE